MSLRIYGNRQLKTLPGQATRPTPARVREAVFNIWQGAIEGCHWLDLCTGSGAMGAEALCRGAAQVVGIEQSSRACAVIQQNWQQVAHSDQRFQVMRGDVLKRLPSLSGQTFDRIYFDPPYASGLYEPVFRLIVEHQLLAPDGAIAAEHSPEHYSEIAMQQLLSTIPPLYLSQYKSYGNTAIAFIAVATFDGAEGESGNFPSIRA
ncbi:16S rRNA (guanine(966)-N(2))-methyltransferase RsmD [Oscillatoria sp. FACHB-1407]|uniref:16S rRNA (guanine(966)-N(2))-methyltransferase RsmD n=1 Tax=Oscillatoria sp. FACHB-1407 TaxID=2692847 RepID=UPI0016891EDB|nr:16S rRNA (guanine(966)-N(2))-methyltransferase RsmD [Oscillatoria sp. FACHB-1407]MBD2464837.1 16S rRNA (guanine(966)-N(2))-methyltransferase RsmD [Oscillatoria sp. FACHB-1407]